MRQFAVSALLICVSTWLGCSPTANSVTTEFYGHYQFTRAERALIDDIAEATAKEVRQHLPSLADPLVLRVRSGKDVIPEIGATAAAIAPDWVVWTVDVDRPEGVSAIATEQLRGTLFHEFHHLVRGSTGDALIDHVVTEGLASAFERDFAGMNRPWAQYPDEARDWLGEILQRPSTAKRNDWLFQHPDGRRWVRYRAGTFLVDAAMRASGKTSAQLVTVSAAEMVRIANVAGENGGKQ